MRHHILLRLIRAASLGALLLLIAACGNLDQEATPTAQPTATSHDALVTRGEELAHELRCFVCHSADGSQLAGPTFKGLAGSQVLLVGGEQVIADSAYLRESIVDPDAKIRQGYSAGVMTGPARSAMPQIESGDNLDALIAYIESLR